jgi:anaerobic ribonucleoside-triphosphate reductase activating protein
MRRCSGCVNPDLWERRPEYEITVKGLRDVIDGITSAHKVDGFTISGGEPMAQPEELDALIQCLKTVSPDILIYTGYKYEALRARNSKCIDNILSAAAVLIDGPYLEERNINVILRGSENQNIIILNNRYKNDYENYLETAHNQIQNFTTADGVISVGIHRSNFMNKIISKINQGGNEND